MREVPQVPVDRVIEPRLRAGLDQLYVSYFSADHLERGEIDNLTWILDGCEVFLDVGASLGMYTYFANRLLDHATIIAVEADPDRYEELARNCATWEALGTNRIRAVHAAVGDSRADAVFYKTGSNISGGMFAVAERSDDYETVTVPQIRLDDLFEPGGHCVAKIDVEGAELRVLRGASRHFAARDTDFLVEFHWWGDHERGTTSLDVLKLLYNQRMTVVRPSPRHKSHLLFRPSRPREEILPSYVHHGPLLVAKAAYGRYAPRAVRNGRERLTQWRRRRRFGRSDGAS
jgi:FkbM family methyltransferase